MDKTLKKWYNIVKLLNNIILLNFHKSNHNSWEPKSLGQAPKSLGQTPKILRGGT